jgi:hypothetical protein
MGRREMITTPEPAMQPVAAVDGGRLSSLGRKAAMTSSSVGSTSSRRCRSLERDGLLVVEVLERVGARPMSP